MPTIRALLLVILLSTSASASELEVFAKGSVSKSYFSSDSWTLSVSIASGLAIQLIPRVRLEGRYTNISSLQNQLDVGTASAVGTINDMKTETSIYSLGLDIDVLNDKAAIQPFIYIGGGYLVTNRSYYFTPTASVPTFYAGTPESGISGNLGLGFRVRLSKSAAFEIEAFAYSTDIDKPSRLINWIGTLGLRLML